MDSPRRSGAAPGRDEADHAARPGVAVADDYAASGRRWDLYPELEDQRSAGRQARESPADQSATTAYETGGRAHEDQLRRNPRNLVAGPQQPGCRRADVGDSQQVGEPHGRSPDASRVVLGTPAELSLGAFRAVEEQQLLRSVVDPVGLPAVGVPWQPHQVALDTPRDENSRLSHRLTLGRRSRASRCPFSPYRSCRPLHGLRQRRMTHLGRFLRDF